MEIDNDKEKTAREIGNANLKPFQAGKSGNPNGRPKGSLNRKTIYANLLEAAARQTITKNQSMTLGENHAPENIAEQIAAGIVIKALAGDLAAADRAFDAAMDKVPEKTELSGSFLSMLAGAETKVGEELSLGDECQTPKPSDSGS